MSSSTESRKNRFSSIHNRFYTGTFQKWKDSMWGDPSAYNKQLYIGLGSLQPEMLLFRKKKHNLVKNRPKCSYIMYENGKQISVLDPLYLFQKKPRMFMKAMPWHLIQKKKQKMDFSHFPTFPDISRRFPTFSDISRLSGSVGASRYRSWGGGDL